MGSCTVYLMEYRVSVLTSGNLEELHHVWTSLFPTVENICYYHSWEWISGVAKYLCADSSQLAYLVVWHGETPVALFPLVLMERRLMGIVPGTEINNPSHDHIIFNDWLCSSEHDPGEVLGALVSNSDQFVPDRWSRFRMYSVFDGASLVNAVLSMTRYRKQICLGQSSYYFDCVDTSVEEIISSHLRKNLIRRRHLADKVGAVTFDYTKASEGRVFNEALDSFFKLEASGWKGQRGGSTAIALSPSLSGFYTNLAKADHSRYSCQINLMKIDGDPVAGQFCFLADGTAYLIKIGFDEALKRCSPGSLLLQDFLQRSMQRRDTRRLSLVTAPPWADRWHPKKLLSYNIQIYNNTLSGSIQLFTGRVNKASRKLPYKKKSSVISLFRKSFRDDYPGS